MYDILDDRDYTKLETYLIERPRYAGTLRNMYADWALDELTIDILAEWSKRDDPEFEGSEIPVVKIIERYVQCVRKLRNCAPIGKRIMLRIAEEEAESLKAVFVEEKGRDRESQQKRYQDGRKNRKAAHSKELAKDIGGDGNRVRGRFCCLRCERHDQCCRDSQREEGRRSGERADQD